MLSKFASDVRLSNQVFKKCASPHPKIPDSKIFLNIKQG
jgi:hypothetical protein